MPPIVPLGDPENPLPILEIVPVQVIIINESVRLLFSENTAFPCRGVNSDQLVQLVTTLIIFKGEEAGVRRPTTHSQEILVEPFTGLERDPRH